MVNVRSQEFPRSVLQADTIIVSCGLANFCGLLGRRSVVTNSLDLTKTWTQGQTTTSLLAVLKTTTLKCATVVPCG